MFHLNSLLARPKSNYIPTLDGLRAVAILLVIASHVMIDRRPNIAVPGNVGVLIFFALSGFLITNRLLDEYELSGRISFRKFYLRRVFRILPPSLFYLAVLSLLVRTGVASCNWAAIRAALFFYANYVTYGLKAYGMPGWRVGHFWSLSVEEHFYLFWPALLVLFGVRKGWRTAAALAVGIVCWRTLDNPLNIIAQLFHRPYLVQFPFRTDLVVDTLLWGCALAFLLRRRDRVSLNSVGATAVTLVAGTLLILPVILHQREVLVVEHLLPSVLLGAIASVPNAPIGRFLELSFMRIIGRMSYSLYIWQQLFLGGFGPRLKLPFALAAILGCALLSYVFIEQPSIRLGHRLLRRGVRKESVSAQVHSANA